jgi:hypothetical protein
MRIMREESRRRWEMPRTVIAALVACLTSGIAAHSQSDRAADLPYAGTWKLNLAKSDFGETTVTYEQTAPSQMQFTAAGQSYTFQTDGRDYPSLFGGTAAWKQLDATTWETALKQEGKLINTVTTKLSADGKTLTTTETGPRPTGGTFERTTEYARVSGGPGLVGVWKTKNPPRWPRIVELVPFDTDGLVIRFPDDRESCEAKFDGKDYAVTGPIATPDTTLAILMTGPRSFDLTGKQAGKPTIRISFAVSDDSKTLTQTGGMVGSKDKIAAVYERQ